MLGEMPLKVLTNTQSMETASNEPHKSLIRTSPSGEPASLVNIPLKGEINFRYHPTI